MVYQLKRTQTNKRPQAFWGSLIPSALSFVGGLITSSQQAKAQRRALEEQQRLAKQQLDINNQNQLASTLNNYALAQQSYDDKDYNLKYRIGGVKRLGSKNIMITDGGTAKRIGNNTYLLRGGSHEDINETGQTGIGINVGGNEIEAEGGEVAQRKGNSLRIYSAQPILGGISPAEAIMRGYNKDIVFNAQQRFKKNNDIKDDGSAKYGFGGYVKGIWNFIRSYRNPVDNIVALATAYQMLNPNSNYNKQKGKFKGGTFRGAGAGGTWTNDYKSNKGFDNFNDAYDDAVEHNAKTFIFGNKRYNTLKENNPIREINNRAVGSWRDSVVTKDRTGYGKDFGPIKGGASLIPLITETYNPKRLRHRLGGGLTSKDRGSSKHPYPSVSSKDFAGSNRSYPIPTKADAIDALRLASLHGRSDVRSKVYSKYPELRKKARGGTKVDPYYDWAKNTSSNLRISFIDPTYDYRTYYNSVTPYERNLIRFAPQGTHFTDIGKTPKHPTFSNESIYSNKKYPGGTWNGNVFVPNIWQFGNNGNKARNKYMNNSGEGYFNGRVNIFPKYRKKAEIGTNIGINANTNIPDYTSTYINWLISQLPSEKNNQQVTKYNQADIDNAINAANLAYQNYLIRQIPSSKSNKQEDNRQNNNRPTRYITADELKRNTQSLVDASRRSVDFANNTYRSKLISQLQSEDKRSLKDKTQSIVDAAKFVVDNAINYRTSKLISQLPNKKDIKQNSKSNNKKETNKVVKRQVRTTPQYTGNTTKGNYQLHDGETKVINGVKYTRRGNTIINHKTNVGYIYDKNGNYTGQADYSKVGNFNQAFDAARAAGRNQFIYRAGKYNNYSTVKETNAKKEALNRRVGARRIAKRMGGLTNPPVERFKCGGRIRPKAENGMLAPIYSYGSDRRRLPSFAPIDVTPRAIPNFKPVSVPINTKTPFDPNSVPFLGNQSTFKPATQDYIGLGIDTLAALGSGMFTRSAYNKMNFDYALPNYVDESPVAFDTTYHNEAQRANIERNRLNARNLIRGNTASAQTSLGRMQQSDTDAMMETNKLLDEKSNKEVELRNQNAANEQQVRARNAAARNQYYQNVAQIKNAAIEAKNNAELAKAQSIGADLSGLSQAWTNFAGSVENRYDTRQNEIAAMSSANSPSVVKNAISLGYNLSPEVLANLYKHSNNEELRNTILGRLSPNERKRYGIK
ncbi:hypothetical protein [Phocaeicola coprophilus]|uniref:hypothetical protein n=1 Tax=Phocaeicola coprophilus TaxID=387090 RepID=UPI003077CDD6